MSLELFAWNTTVSLEKAFVPGIQPHFLLFIDYIYNSASWDKAFVHRIQLCVIRASCMEYNCVIGESVCARNTTPSHWIGPLLIDYIHNSASWDKAFVHGIQLYLIGQIGILCTEFRQLCLSGQSFCAVKAADLIGQSFCS